MYPTRSASAKLMQGAIALPGYQITEQLYAGSRTLVYRAQRKADYQPVVIKLLKHEHPSFSELLQFRNQYAITANLNIPGIIQPYSLEPYRNGYALVMEDFGGLSLWAWMKLRHDGEVGGVGGERALGEAGETGRVGEAVLSISSASPVPSAPIPLADFFPIAVQLIDILHQLHQQRIIHKDIKPANLLIHPETQQIKLIDFSIASLLPRETQEIQNPNILEGTLAYLSPEQTGRMNRGIDYRSDFYALGVTFFELLTSQLPFSAVDPMALVHCHLAQQPPHLCDVNAALPLMLGEIVRKLMAKTAEDRYQTAFGLKHDLVKCQEEWHLADQPTWFTLGQRDISDRFLISEKLYGRETEVQTLLESFGRVANGATELMLVAGFSGIGKTAVVNEIHKPIVRWNGYFIKGKYDQFNRNIPFSAVVQACRDLVGQLFAESDQQLQAWKAKILAALGENGQVMIEVIPELERIIGNQPPAPELSGSAAQHRFHLLFQTFIAVFATLEHPLVLFLDDLQWADSASLNLMQVLLSQRNTGHLLLLGAYRDHEVFPAHPLLLTLDEIAKAEATINTLTLKPLSQSDVNDLVAETLSCTPASALPITELVYQKTKGNPFFATQFLKALHEEGYITFDPKAGCWQCDLAPVRSLALTDDVVEFMALQLQKLPVATQNVLKLAACIGAQFDLETLAIVSEQTAAQVAVALWKALQEGLILPISEIYKFYQPSDVSPQLDQETFNCAYRFLHDRVQQAAYSLIADDQKQSTHLQIGRLLQHATAKPEQNELFTIVNHFNQGASLLEDAQEQQALVQLNLATGQKAKSATAYGAALAYFNQGIALLRGDRWQSQYDLALALYEGAAESAYLSGDFEQMGQLVQVVLAHVESWLDRVNIYTTQLQACIAQNRQLEALQLAREVLEPLGVLLPEHPTPAAIGQALQQTQALLSGRSIESLLALPEMTVPESKAAMVVISSVIPAAYQSAPSLLPLLILAQVDLSVQYGNAPESTSSYVMYGTIQISVLDEIDAGYRFGLLGINLLDRLYAPKLYAKTLFNFNNAVSHWKEPAKDTLSGYLQAYAKGLESGDIQFAVLSLLSYGYTAYFCGKELLSLSRVMEAHQKVMQQCRQDAYRYKHSIYYQSVLNLLEAKADPDRLCSEHYDEAEMIPLHLKTNDVIALFQLYFSKLLLSYLFQRYEQALENARLTEQYLDAAAGLMHIPMFYFYDALVQLALYPTASKLDQATRLDRVADHQKKLSQWAVYAPGNQAHRCLLVEAERCRVLGQKVEAIDLYDRAITLAKANSYIQEAALTNELAAKFYLAWGKERIAQEYMTEAYYSYARWGAKAKIADLEKRYPALLAPILQQPRTALSVNETVFATVSATASSSSSSASDSLDLATILKISQTLFSAIELDQLISVLLHAVIQTAGAAKCVLMLLEDKDLMVQATATMSAFNQVEVQVHTAPQPTQTSPEIPLSLINSVKRHLQSAVILDATVDPQFVADHYIQTHQPKSLLCSPILHQGKLLGIMYLENNLATGAFTHDRLELLNLLCAQAAISLENARLYGREQEKSRSLQGSLEQLKQTEATLFQEREFLNAIIHNIIDGIVVCDASGKLTLFNQATREFHGLPVESLPAEQWAEHFDLYQPDGQTPLATTEIPLFRALQGEIVENAEMVIAPKHGSRRILLASGQAIIDASGNKLGAVVVMRDVSDRKQAEIALQQKSHALGKALADLQNAQLQIVQSEKMSALGNLVAGVAHEINNPVGFIAGNLKPALDYVQDTFGLLDLYQQEYPHPSAVIQAEIEAIDLEYVREDLPKLVASMQLGVDRIRSISTSLRTFSRADKEYKVPFNIHEGIDSTILILKHRLKANEQRPAIEVVTNYGNLPQIECFPGQLNQVFMNLLANAIDALDESNHGCSFEEIKANPNCITMTTSVESNSVKITIADNGKGISEQVKSKIFDYLFTTKAVGQGTGLGLAIVRQIVEEKHSGCIHVQSQAEVGTVFTLTLPVRSPLI